MKNARLLSTVAATFLLAVGAASAQDVKKDEGPARAPAAQQNAPAEKVAPAMKPGAKNARGQKAPETTGQAPAGDRTDASDKGAMDKKKDKGAAAKGSSANGSGDVKVKTNENTAQGATGAKSSHSTTAEKDRATTGQGAASGSTKLSTEQRTKITNIIRQQKVAPAHLNVSIRVGNRVPASVRFYPLPAEVFVVYPEWRGTISWSATTSSSSIRARTRSSPSSKRKASGITTIRRPGRASPGCSTLEGWVDNVR